MNKKRLIQFIAIIVSVIVLIFVWLFISFWNGRRDNNWQQTNNDSLNPQEQPTARDAADWNAPFMKKMEVKFMDKEEKAKMNLADDPMTRLQVLERDSEGNITAYKKVYLDSDIIEYVYDPNGANASTTEATPAAATNASGTTAVVE